MIGTKIAHYEITSHLGTGGMGEVYQATDSKLGRRVAIKLLPEAFTHDVERAARFEREARVLASLNHLNIAAIHGIEQSGGRKFLVMELVPGENLAERIKRGPIAIADALDIAKQITEGLEAAHEKGVIHRDLKPANVKITPDGNVKLLDFGLAKAMEPAGAMSPSASMSPTITTIGMTQSGMILGTASYMSPEQARGKTVDKRADIWAYGCVVYEMLTGARVFDGEDAAETIGAVIHKEPVWSRLPTETPAPVRTILRRCLQRDPKQRIRDIGDVRLALEGAFDQEPSAVHATPPLPLQPLWRRIAGLAAVAVGTSAFVGAALWIATRPMAPRVARLAITATGPAMLTINDADRDLAVTPDGSRVVYVGNNGTQLFVRALDALEPVAIASGQLKGPFISPDGQWVGFIDNARTLMKVAITGGPPIPLAPLDGVSRGATWLPDDTIVVATTNVTGLLRVSSGGGVPTALTHPDRTRGEADHLWPQAVPGGRAVLFTITAQTGGLDAASIAVLDLRTNTQTILVRGGTQAHAVPSGHLVYTTGGTLRAVPFDLGGLTVRRGPAVPVVPQLVTTQFGSGDFDIATDGMLVYIDAPADAAASTRTLVWVDRTGKEEPITAPPRGYEHPRLSPDGTRLAMYIADQAVDISVWDLRRMTLTRLTFDQAWETFPVWTPDSRRIVFASQRGDGVSNLWWQAADGTGTAERLTTSANVQVPTGLSPDATQVVFHEVTPMMGRDLLQLTLAGARRIAPLLQTPSNERNGVVSPDGRWLAYESDSSGRSEIYVRPFPNAAAGQWQVSTAGGTRPLWAHSGTELFFLGTDGALMRLPVEATAPTWNAGAPAKLLDPGYYTGGDAGRSYDVSSDDRRFLMIKTPGRDPAAAPPRIIVVQHFDEELKRLVPTN